MIKSIEEIIEDITYCDLNKEQQIQILKEWALEIISECSSKLIDDGTIQEGWLYQKIEKVGEQIK